MRNGRAGAAWGLRDSPGRMASRYGSWLAVFVLAVLTLSVDAAHAQPGRRVALIIGNSGYGGALQLATPQQDARLIAGALEKASFASVVLKTDQRALQLRNALEDFEIMSQGAEVALIYFAGHGMEMGGENYLAPIGARLTGADAMGQMLPASEFMRAVRGARTRVIILDACRNNPTTGATVGRGVGRGLARIEAGSGIARFDANDVLIMYSAGAGEVASDGVTHSPFAEALAYRLLEPGLDLRLLAGKVRDDVLAATGNRQRPYLSASMSGDVMYLMPPVGIKLEEAAVTPRLPRRTVRRGALPPLTVGPTRTDLHGNRMWDFTCGPGLAGWGPDAAAARARPSSCDVLVGDDSMFTQGLEILNHSVRHPSRLVGYDALVPFGRALTSSDLTDIIYIEGRNCYHAIFRAVETGVALSALPFATTPDRKEAMDVAVTEIASLLRRMEPKCDQNIILGWAIAGPVAVRLAYEERMLGRVRVRGFSYFGDVAGYLGDGYFPMAFNTSPMPRGAMTMSATRFATPQLYVRTAPNAIGVEGLLASIDAALGR